MSGPSALSSAPRTAQKISDVVPAAVPLVAWANTTTPSGPSPLTVSLLGAAHGGTPPYAWSWAVNVSFAQTQNASLTLSSPGSYTVALTVTDGTGAIAVANTTVVVTSGSLSVFASASPLAGPPPLYVNFQATPSGGSPPYTSWSWNFGDGTAGSSVQNPSHTYLSLGSFTATVTVQDASGATASASVNLEVANLTAKMSASPASGSAPLTVTFTGAAGGGTAPYIFNWTFGDGGVAASGTASVNHTYASSGVYLATLEVIDAHNLYAYANTSVDVTPSNGSSGSLAVSVSATPPAGAAPLPVLFSSSTSGGTAPYTWAWTFGDGTTSALASTTHVFQAAGVYKVSLVVTDVHGNTGTASVFVSVNGTSGGGAGGLNASVLAKPTSGTSPLTVVFQTVVSGGTAPYTYQWLFGDGQGSTAAAPTHTYLGSGNFLATLQVVDSAGNAATTSIVISVTPSGGGGAGGGSCGNCSPSPQISAPASSAVGQVVTFTAGLSGAPGTYQVGWVFGDGHTAWFSATVVAGQVTTMEVQHTYQQSGSFHVSCTVTGATTSPSSTVVSLTIGAPSSAGHPGVPWTFWALAATVVGAVALSVLLITRQQGRRGRGLLHATSPRSPLAAEDVLDPYGAYQNQDLSAGGAREGSSTARGPSADRPRVGLL